jgi:NAD(P)-dependent dehydrogenase (short-subunit alcohol dehydrogenase family)
MSPAICVWRNICSKRILRDDAVTRGSTQFGGGFDLSGKVAIVTGAGGYLGAQICQGLGDAGAFIVIACRNNDKAQSVRTALEMKRIESITVGLDVTDEISVRGALEKVFSRYGRIDILVNNAGVATNRMVEELDLLEWNRVVAVNLTGTFLCSKIFCEPMLSQRRGSVINVSSIYGVVAPDQRIYGDTGRNSSLVYAATKAGIIQMTRYLAVYWADKGVRVNCISPGGILRNQEPDFVNRYSSRVPMNRMASLKDIPGAVVFLASDASSYITGQNIVIDGGLTSW